MTEVNEAPALDSDEENPDDMDLDEVNRQILLDLEAENDDL